VRGASNRPYNVGSGHGLTIADTAAAVNEAFGGGLDVIVAGKPMPGQRGSRYVPSVERAERELGLVPRVDLQSGIRRTADWYNRTA
jgi:dTDP-glucose 4,6-dehydratase